MAHAKKSTAKRIDWAAFHRAFTHAPEDLCFFAPPSLRSLSRRFGVSFAEADRHATLGYWELERDANYAKRWHAMHGRGATNEEEFVSRFAQAEYRHLDGPAGLALARAWGRRVWWSYAAPTLRWETTRELEAAKRAFDRTPEGLRLKNNGRSAP